MFSFSPSNSNPRSIFVTSFHVNKRTFLSPGPAFPRNFNFCFFFIWPREQLLSLEDPFFQNSCFRLNLNVCCLCECGIARKTSILCFFLNAHFFNSSFSSEIIAFVKLSFRFCDLGFVLRLICLIVYLIIHL